MTVHWDFGNPIGTVGFPGCPSAPHITFLSIPSLLYHVVHWDPMERPSLMNQTVFFLNVHVHVERGGGGGGGEYDLAYPARFLGH